MFITMGKIWLFDLFIICFTIVITTIHIFTVPFHIFLDTNKDISITFLLSIDYWLMPFMTTTLHLFCYCWVFSFWVWSSFGSSYSQKNLFHLHHQHLLDLLHHEFINFNYKLYWAYIIIPYWTYRKYHIIIVIQWCFRMSDILIKYQNFFFQLSLYYKKFFYKVQTSNFKTIVLLNSKKLLSIHFSQSL